ncbi:hypothetical protein ACMFMG_010303 [Clarireedia jacksonii]
MTRETPQNIVTRETPQHLSTHSIGAPGPSPTTTEQSGSTAYSPSNAFHNTSNDPYMDTTDPATDLTRPLRGWPMLTKLMSDVPDFEAFPQFKALNIKSLLYYQAELDEIQKELHELEYHDYRHGKQQRNLDPSKWANNLGYLMMCEYEDTAAYRQQWDLIKRMRKVLKEYNKALLQYTQVSALPKADPYNVKSLLAWLRAHGRGDDCIRGPGAHAWGNIPELDKEVQPLWKQFLFLLCSLFWNRRVPDDGLDLIVPKQGRKVDGLTHWVANEFVPFWQCLKDSMRWKKSWNLPCFTTSTQSISEKRKTQGPISRVFISASDFFRKKPSGHADSKSRSAAGSLRLGLNIYSTNRMLRFTSSVATVLACLLPTVAIAVLAQLNSTRELIGVIAAFTAIFAIGLMWLTDGNTSRVEIFTATAAFSAVMVVFVQNQSVGPYATGVRALNGTDFNVTNG